MNTIHYRLKAQPGYILLSVVFTLTILATLSFLLSQQSAIDTGMANKEQQRQAAQYTAQAGLNHAIWQYNQDDCTGYTDLNNVTLGSNSYSVTVTPTSGSPVSIISASTDSNGASYSINRDGIKFYKPEQQLIIQPDTTAGKDTYIYEWKSTWNYGLSGELWADDVSYDSTARSLLEFDLTGLPDNVYILKATLELYQNSPSANGGAISVHRITSVWEEGIKKGNKGEANWTKSDTAISWATGGGDFDATTIATTTLTAGTRAWNSWEIATLVQDWNDGKYPNHGLLLNPAPGASAYFASSDNGDGALHPKLTITYVCECGKVCDPPVASCNADYIADNTVSEFATTSYSSTSIKGLTYFPEGTKFKSVTSPAGGAWVSVDSSTDTIYMTDLSGSLLAWNATPGTSPTGVSFINSGSYADHLVVSDFSAQGIAFVKLDGSVADSINTASVGATNPVDVAFIGTTAGGSYDGLLALLNVDGMIYIIDQSGTLKASIDVTGITSQPEGIVHLPDNDLLMLVDRGLDKSLIIDFSGNLGNSYSTASFGSSVPYAITINPLTCEHAIGDLNVDKVITVNNSSGG